MKKKYLKPIVMYAKFREKNSSYLADRKKMDLHKENKREMKNEKKICANSEFIYREIADESVLIPTGNAAKEFNGLASLNKTGAFLWKLLEQKRTLLELIWLFAEEYELTERECADDVAEFLAQASTKNLVIWC